MDDPRSLVRENAFSRVSPQAMRIGVTAWAALGVVGILVVFAWVFSITASIAIPLLIALVLGFLLVPAVDWLEQRKIPRTAGAAIVLIALLLVFAGLITLVIVSLANGLGDITAGVHEGVLALEEWLASINIPADTAQAIGQGVSNVGPALVGGLAHALTSSIGGLVTGIVMTFIALYICFLMLIDSGEMLSWGAGHMGVPRAVGEEILDDTARAIRGYFKGTTLLGLVTGVVTSLGLALFGVPLAILIGVVTAALSYIPYIGAFVAGAFAVLIAFGGGGPHMALMALLVVVFTQTVVQSLVQAPLMGSALKMNAVVVFVMTILGGITAGALGAMLAAPAMSAVLDINRTLARAKAERQATTAT